MKHYKGKCSICRGNHCATINALIRDGRTVRSIANEFGVTDNAVKNHIKNCGILKGSLSSIKEEYEKLKTDSIGPVKTTLPSEIERSRVELNVSTLSENIKVLYTSCLQVMAEAEEQGSNRLKLSAIKEARQILEMVIRASSLVLEKKDETDWKVILEIILIALEPFPEAKIAVSEALGELI